MRARTHYKSKRLLERSSSTVVIITLVVALISTRLSAEQTGNSSTCVVRLSANATASGHWSELPAPFHGFCSYVGISYAQPPLGALRFEASYLQID